MRYPREGYSDISIVICGEAGQGIQTVEEILVKASKRSGFHVFSVKEYMSRIRGGSNSTSIRIGVDPIRAPVRRMDIAVPLSKGALDHIKWRSDENSTILLDSNLADEPESYDHGPVVKVDIKNQTKEVGGPIYENTVSAGLICSLLDFDKAVIGDILKERFKDRQEDVYEKNLKALDSGFEIGRSIIEKGEFNVDLKASDETEDRILMKGIQSIALGAVSGGCDFISSYPMSPSTGVLVGLASRQKKYGIVAEQAEDEISAINMTLGAWYAGGRGMVTTSGGGYSLMAEGLSLAGMLEMPVVIHLAQRPGPATGLPTRTEQGDLFLALFSGHGEFPRVIFAPGTPEDGFNLTARAFDLADRFQIPVIIMTDQFMVDSYTDLDGGDLELKFPLRHIVRTDADYLRYRYSMNGISERGIPGYGEGIVNVDSDEHDEEGHITESMITRDLMMEKRMAKMEALREEALKPHMIGDGKGDIVICWGSTLETVKEAVDSIQENISILHISQLYPLSKKVNEVLSKCRRKICLENNYTGQLARLLRMETGLSVDHTILKYSGLPFTVEEVAESLGKYLATNGGEN